jgi:hypothetical protein
VLATYDDQLPLTLRQLSYVRNDLSTRSGSSSSVTPRRVVRSALACALQAAPQYLRLAPRAACVIPAPQATQWSIDGEFPFVGRRTAGSGSNSPTVGLGMLV